MDIKGANGNKTHQMGLEGTLFNKEGANLLYNIVETGTRKGCWRRGVELVDRHQNLIYTQRLEKHRVFFRLSPFRETGFKLPRRCSNLR